MAYTSRTWALIKKHTLNRLQLVQNWVLCIIGGYDLCTRIEQRHFNNKIPTQKLHQTYDFLNCMHLRKPAEVAAVLNNIGAINRI